MPRGAAHRDAGRVSWSGSVSQTWVPRKEPSEFIHPPLLAALVKRNYAQREAEHVGRTSHIGTEKARQEEKAQQKAEKIRQDALEVQREAEKMRQKALEVQREAEKMQQKALEVQQEAGSDSDSNSGSNSGSDSGSDSDSGEAAKKTQVQRQTEEEPLEDTKPILTDQQAGFARDELRANKSNKGKGPILTAAQRATRFAALRRRTPTLKRPQDRRADDKRIQDLEAQVFDGAAPSATTIALPVLLSLVERVCGPVQEMPEDEHVACALAQVALTARKRKLSTSLKAQKSHAPKRARK